MRRFLVSIILAGAVLGQVGCKSDKGSITSPQMDEGTNGSAAKPVETASAVLPAPTNIAVRTPDSRPLIVCFGDSLTAGYGADDGESYPDFLQKDLDRDGYNYRVVNEGISGNTTKDGVDRLPGIVAMKPEVVILALGGNDGLRGFKVPTTRANLSTMISGLQRGGAKVVLAGITLPPDYGPDYISAFTQTYPLLSKKYRVPMLPFLLKDVYGVEGMMQADNTHATDKGNEVVARNVLPLVEPLLSK
jgi:acyl-CoA thioesterase-1